MLEAAGTGLLVLAYLLAVVDGARQDTTLYPSAGGPMGLRTYAREHPWIVMGAVSGAVGAVLVAVG
jgi:hypothetical protein